MKRSLLLWILAFLITTAAAIYQRVTGPTYPVKGSLTLAGQRIEYKLERSHGSGNCPVEIATNNRDIHGVVSWKRYNTDDPWTNVEMAYGNDGMLAAELPHQPPAGKLEYRVVLTSGAEQAGVPAGGSTVIRFKGDVPFFILIPHIFAMFFGMLLSTRSGLALFDGKPRLKPLVGWTLACLCVGGFLLGPFVQWYAFGAFWTGWPFGGDLTDNKTAVAILAWLAVAFMLRRSARPERWALGAAIVTLAVFMIPHSLLGSELKYEKLPAPTSMLQRRIPE